MDPRTHWRLLTGAAAAVLAAGFLAPWIAPAPVLEEKRALAQAPPWPRSPGGLAIFRKAADAWVADRFPARPHLIGLVNWLRMQAGVSGSERVIVGRRGWLFYDDGRHLAEARNDPPISHAQTYAWLATLAGRTEALTAQGIPYLVVAAPQKETVYPGLGPRWYGGPAPDRFAVTLPRWAAQTRAGEVIYLHDAVALPTRFGLRTFSPADTHWTGVGAHAGYEAIMRRLQAMGVGEAPRPLADFDERAILPAHQQRDLTLMLGVASFVDPDFPEFEDPRVNPKVRYLTANQSWTGAQVIDTGVAGKPTLLITYDSFSSSLMPFLMGHFSRIVAAHNQDGSWRPDLVERFHPDVVMLEVEESGLAAVMEGGPPAAPGTLARLVRWMETEGPPEAPPPPVRPLDLSGGPGNETLSGGPGDDRIVCRAGDDVALGGAGRDVIQGGRGADRLDGGDGWDWLSGDLGPDTLTGGGGADTFHVAVGGGADVVTDFSVAQADHVAIAGGRRFTLRQVGADTVVEIEGGDSLLLKGVQASDLEPDSIGVLPPAVS